MQLVCLLTALLVGLVAAWPDAPCRPTPPIGGYSDDLYLGRWYDIGSIERVGSAFYEKDCVCPRFDVARSRTDPTALTITAVCNKNTPTGKRIVANGTLTSVVQPSDGRYTLTVGHSRQHVPYNLVVMIPEFVTVEYDCAREFGFSKYGVHIRSRTPTLNTAIVNKYLDLVQQLNLNPAKAEFVLQQQPTCNYD